MPGFDSMMTALSGPGTMLTVHSVQICKGGLHEAVKLLMTDAVNHLARVAFSDDWRVEDLRQMLDVFLLLAVLVEISGISIDTEAQYHLFLPVRQAEEGCSPSNHRRSCRHQSVLGQSWKVARPVCLHL